MNRVSLCSLLQLLPWLLVIFGSSNFVRAENLEKMFVDEIMGASFKDLAEQLTNSCNQTYGSKAAENFKAEFNKTQSCVRAAIDDNQMYVVLSLSSIFGPHNAERENLTFAILLNEILPTIRNECITPFIPVLKGCTDLDGHRNIATLESLVDFFTENGGRRYYDYMYDENGLRCMDQYQDEIVQCFEQLPILISQLQGNVSIFNKENCRLLDDQSNCAIRSVEKGCSITTVNILKEAKALILKGTDCSAKLANKKTSNLSHNSILIDCLITQKVKKSSQTGRN